MNDPQGDIRCLSSHRTRKGANQAMRAVSIPQRVASDIRRLIARNELKPGDALPPEAELIERYQISRPTLREAMRILETESLVVVRRGGNGGAIVQQLQVEVVADSFGVLLQQQGITLADIYQARMVLEPPALARLARSATPEIVAALRQDLLRAELEIGSPAGYSHAIALFRERMIEAAGNYTLALMVRLLRDIIERHNANVGGAWEEDWARLQRLSLKSHLKLLDLVQARDAAGVETFWLQHMQAVTEHLLKNHHATTAVELYL